MQLTKIRTLSAILHCESGLRIGAGDVEMHIGGIDNPIIRDPLTQQPYIPGSSLKGKIRSLLEWRSGFVKNDDPFSWSTYKESNKNEEVLTIVRMFGSGAGDKLTLEEAKVLGPTRLSFWDCQMTKEWVKKCLDKGIPLTEVKSENTIDRIKAEANPRVMERVIAETEFVFKVSVKQLDGDGDKCLNTLLEGMKLLELDSLGGSGSRGSGKVSFRKISVDGDESWDKKYQNEIKPFHQQ